MKICVAQTRPFKGDMQANLSSHLRLIHRAADHSADMIIFPELSMTGYEPGLVEELASLPNDDRFDQFQTISEAKNITIGIGVPTRHNPGIFISLLIFQPGQNRQIYSKKYLHEDETPYFTPGPEFGGLNGRFAEITFAICYEISVSVHPEKAAAEGARIYIASVAKSVIGTKTALKKLSEIAKKHRMTVLMANYVGYCDDFSCGGKSSVWNDRGQLLGQLDDHSEGLLMIDTGTGAISY